MKKAYSALAFTAAFGLLAGCSSNQPTDEAPEAVEPEAVETVEQAVIETVDEGIVIDTTFYFEFDSAQLTTAARAALMLHAEQLTSSPRAVRLEGHADERGSREYNMALGERRADAVRKFLILQGVSAAAIEIVSYGEEQPASLGSSEGSWSQNRRVELK